MIWFKHPNDLPNDKRLAALIDNEGCRGYGMYLRIIEMLCAQPDRKLSFNQLNIISRKGFSRKYMEKIIWGKPARWCAAKGCASSSSTP